MTKPGSRAEALLYELCVKYGYCLPVDMAEAILAKQPEDADEFLDAVLVANGGGPAIMDARARNQLRDVVCDWLFDQGRGRGTQSGLPDYPHPS